MYPSEILYCTLQSHSWLAPWWTLYRRGGWWTTKILTVVRDVGLTNPLCQKMNALSTVERSRARIAGHHTRPRTVLYILDEPSLGLDRKCEPNHHSTQGESEGGSKFHRSRSSSFVSVLFQHHFHFGPGAGIQGGQILPIRHVRTLIQQSLNPQICIHEDTHWVIPLYEGAYISSLDLQGLENLQLKRLHAQVPTNVRSVFCFWAI